MTKFFPNLVNSGWLWWIMRVLLTNQKGGNILNEQQLTIIPGACVGYEIIDSRQ